MFDKIKKNENSGKTVKIVLEMEVSLNFGHDLSFTGDSKRIIRHILFLILLKFSNTSNL